MLAALVGSYAGVQLIPWGGVSASQRSQQRVARELAGETDFLILGDSKAGPFSAECLSPWIAGRRGLVFTADSVTPVFYYHNLSQIRSEVSGFQPRWVFIFIGANNFNAHGLHVERDFAFLNEIGLGDAWRLSGARGEYLMFAEALASRIFPLYGMRVPITHLQIGESPGTSCAHADAANFARVASGKIAPASRDAILDRNYFDIYRRSVYASYESSPVIASATEMLIELVRGYGGTPVLVLPPVTSEMRALEFELIGDAFDASVREIAGRTGVQVLDLRDRIDYEFADVNHLSVRGARDVLLERFRPLIESGDAAPAARVSERGAF